jgi:hypothetical protein
MNWKSIYRWLLVIALAVLFSKIINGQVASEVTATYTPAVTNPSVWLNAKGNENFYFVNDTCYILTDWTNTYGRHHGRWIPGTDTLYGRRFWTYQGAFAHSVKYNRKRGDTLFVYTKRSTLSTNYFMKMNIDAAADPTILDPVGNYNAVLHGMFMQNDTFFVAMHPQYFMAFGNSSGLWDNSYQDYKVPNNGSGYPTSFFQFSDSEDAYFTHTTYGLQSSTPYTSNKDTSWIFKRTASTGVYGMVKVLNDSLSYRGMITGYIDGGGDHILYLVAQHPRYGALVHRYNVDTDALTTIGVVHEILGIGIDSAAVNNIASTPTGTLWMNAGNKYTATVADTAHNRVYRYSGSSWIKLEQFPTTAAFTNVRNWAPNKLGVIGDSVFIGWGVEGIAGIDSTQADDPTSNAWAWASVSIELTVTYPNGGETFTSGEDTVTVTWTQSGVDSVYIYYSTNAGSSWILVDSTGDASYTWIVPDVLTSQGRIKVADVFGGAEDQSDNSFNILPTGARVTILEPDGATYTLSGDNLKFVIESYLVDSMSFYYSKNGSTWWLIQENVAKGGDANPPDTTVIWWDASVTSLLTTTYFKVETAGDSNVITGNPNPLLPYYSRDTLVSRGQRGVQQKAQGTYRWSNFFTSNDILFTVGYYAFVWGWYDYSDAIYCFYWNPLSNSWAAGTGTATPGEAFYPTQRAYHKSTSGTPYLVYHNEDLPSIHKDAIWTAAIPPVLSSGLTTYYESLSDAGIDITTYPGDNDSVDYNGWRYYLSGSGGDIYAKDLINTEQNIDFYLLDADSVDALDAARLNIFAFDSLLFISNSDHKGNLIPFNEGIAIAPYEIVYTAPVLSQPYTFTFDTSSITAVEGQQRNYFRGIYPEAIIIMRSGK